MKNRIKKFRESMGITEEQLGKQGYLGKQVML